MVKEEKKTNQKPRLSYDELVGLAGQLSAENKRLKLTLEDASRNLYRNKVNSLYSTLSLLLFDYSTFSAYMTTVPQEKLVF